MQKIPESLRRVNSILNADKTPDTANINSINNISGNSNPPLKVYKIHFNNVLPNNVSDMAVREMSGGSVCLEKNREYSRDLVHESFMTHGNGNAEKEYQSLYI
ncbi:MAG: hypothetical protein FDW93_04910 [Bergeyella sp.]|nr:hypothetical protein [Bergeyella sp.]